MHGIVDGVMQSPALFPFYRPSGDQIGGVDHVTQFADVLACLHSFEEVFRLLIEHVESVPGAFQSQVGAYDADIVRHDFAHLLHGLRDEHLLLVGHRALIVPFRHLFVELVLVDMLQTVLGGSVGIDHCLDE